MVNVFEHTFRIKMLKSYLKAAWRNILRYKSYSTINLGGLAISISAFYLLLTYATDEFSYDKFHNDVDRIYRITNKIRTTGMQTAMSANPWGPQLVKDYPEVEAYTRCSFYFFDVPVMKGEEIIFEDEMLLVDSTFFDVFDFKLLAGDRRTVLDEMSDVVITEELAFKYFDDPSPLGKTIRVSLNGRFRNYQVSGVVENPPSNSHLKFTMLFNMNINFEIYGNDPDNWWRHNGFTYLKLSEGTSHEQVIEYFPTFFEKHSGPEFVERFDPSLQPITDIHLHSDLFGEIAPNGNITYVRIALFMSFFILLIGCVNYVNLSTALSIKRAKEVGARKVLGAFRKQLVLQFLVESMVVSLLSIIACLVILYLVQPLFNNLADKEIVFDVLSDGIKLVGIGVMVGIISGLYPALVLSKFEPIKIIKGKFMVSRRGVFFRRILIVLQFSISIVLFIGTGVMYSQIQFVNDKELGFDKKGVMVMFGLTIDQLNNDVEVFKNELLQNPGIKQVAVSSGYPGNAGIVIRYRPEGYSGSDQELPSTHTIYANQDAIEIFDLEMKAGRNFNETIASDSMSLIINESAAKLFGYEDPVGRTLTVANANRTEMGPSRRIIGVVKDFHFESLHNEIKPLVFSIDPQRHNNILVKYNTEDHAEVLTHVETLWKREFPEQAINYNILEDEFNQLHSSDFQLQKILTACSVLAIFIASLGLFGLATFMAQQKLKEIGIRKVLGASQSAIIASLNKEFTVPVLIAAIMGIPLAYYLMNLWLDNFTYRVDFNYWLIPIAGLASLSIAWLTVSYKSLKASNANPVDALRQE